MAAKKSKGGGCGCGTIVLVLLAGVLILVLIVVGLVGWTWWRTTSAPGPWRQQQAYEANHPVSQRRASAARVEKRLVSRATRFSDSRSGPQAHAGGAGPGGSSVGPVRVVRLSFHQINDWLDYRFGRFLANQDRSLPKQVENPTVWSEGGRLVLGFRLNTPRLSPIVSLVLNARMLESGRMRLRLEHVRVGKMTVPARMAANQLGRLMPNDPRARRQLKRLMGLLDGYTFEPVHDLPEDTREVRLVDFKVLPEGVRLKVRVGEGGSKAEG